MDYLLGASDYERRCRFILGSGILVLASLCSMFLIVQTDRMVLELRESAMKLGGSNDLVKDSFTQAGLRLRVQIIVVAEVAAIVGLVYASGVVRYILLDGPRPRDGQR